MLRQRVITGLIALALLLVLVFVMPALAVEVVIAALILAGAWEWSGFLKLESNIARLGYVGLMAALLAAVVVLADERTVELLFKVEVESVQVCNIKGKVKSFRNSPGRRRHRKKAYIKLKPGFDIDYLVGAE